MGLYDFNTLTMDPVIDAASELLGVNICDLYLFRSLVEMDVTQIIGYAMPEDDHTLDNIKVDMLIHRYRRTGSEDLKSYGAAGVSETYLTDYPENVIRQLRSRRRVKML